MGPPRHLSLLPELAAEQVEWPIPFAGGVAILEGLRGRRVAVLASGDPFWFGAGSVIARHFAPHEWRALPGVSCFSLAAARLGWPLEQIETMGLHASSLSRLRPYLAPGLRAIVTLRDGDAVADLARWLVAQGFGKTTLHVMEALGGPRERIRRTTAAAFNCTDVGHPVCVALDCAGEGAGGGAVIPLAGGRPDRLFENDGQITRRPVRALTLSALAPRPGDMLWDIGGGSGAIALEWLLAHPRMRAVTIEARTDRAARIRRNAETLGLDGRLDVVTGAAPKALAGLALPDAVFIGGGLSEALLAHLWTVLPEGTRLVANAVTLESESLLVRWHADKGGELLRIALCRAAPLGPRRGWKGDWPILQWSVSR